MHLCATDFATTGGIRSEMREIHGHADSSVGAVTLSTSQKCLVACI